MAPTQGLLLWYVTRPQAVLVQTSGRAPCSSRKASAEPQAAQNRSPAMAHTAGSDGSGSPVTTVTGRPSAALKSASAASKRVAST